MGLAGFNVEAKTVRGMNLKQTEATPQTVLREGDVIVLLGGPEDLVSAEKILLTGKYK